jgi:hypothetical protein
MDIFFSFTKKKDNYMEFHGIPIGSVWRFLKWTPGVVLRKVFPKERLSALQYVDLIPRGDSFTVNLGECASFEAWLNIINLSPFMVEFDRAEFTFWFGGISLKTTRSKKEMIQPGQTLRFPISEVIPDGMANQIKRNCHANDGNQKASISGFIEFNCQLHSFCRNVHDLSDIRPRIVNLNSVEYQ